MIKKLYSIVKRIVFSFFFLYGYNLIAFPLNLFIPINICTILILSILGIPSLFSLMIILLLAF